MESQILEIAISNDALISLENIYEYGISTFSYTSATIFIEELIDKIESLSTNYLFYPECRHMRTKSQMYRNMIFGSYLVIYRITDSRIEVLNIIHGSRSVTAIRSIRKIKLT